MTRHVLEYGLAVVATIALAACGSGAAGNRPEAGRPPVAVETVPVTAGEVAETIDIVGSLKPKYEATIQSEYTAIVRKVMVTEWVHVTKGQPLAQLDSREADASLAAAKAAVLQAEVAETRAVREHERTIKLRSAGLATQQNLDDAASARSAAEAATASARAQLTAAETYAAKQLIVSPLDGVVAMRGVNVGDRVESMGSGTPMFRIVDNRLFDLTVTVPSVDMARLQVGQPLTFASDTFPGRTFEGRVAFINPAVDETNRSVKVVAEVHNPSGELRAGLFVKGQIHTGTRSSVLLVPRGALLAWDVAASDATLFVAKGAIAERRQVRTGAVSGEMVEVASGLAAGDSVITRGAFNLKDGDRIDVVKSETTGPAAT